jgi:hypothetical protein
MAVTVYVNDPDAVRSRVESIVEIDEDVDISEYIDSALMLVVGLAQPAEYSQVEMERLHAWLAAHFYEVNYQRSFEKEIGRARDKPETKVDLGLNLTRPGQQVLVLDYKKAFTAVAEDGTQLRRPRVFWAGNPRPSFPSLGNYDGS